MQSPLAIPALDDRVPVELRGVSRVFRDAVVLRELDLRVDAGEVHALIGPNGAGKTTLLRIVSGLLAPSAGSVRVFGSEATDPSNRSRIGWVPAGDRTFYLRISGRENLLFYARLHGLGKREAKPRVEQLLAAVDLEQAADRPAGEYSQGMLKRLGIARALIPEPTLLLFDEATHDLDIDGSAVVHRMVSSMAASGAAVMWATQRLEELPGLADTVTVLGREGVLFQGTVDRLLAEARIRAFIVRVEMLPDQPIFDRMRDRLGLRSRVEPLAGSTAPRLRVELGDGDRIGPIITLLEDSGVRVTSCTEQEAEIRLAFRAVTEAP